MRIAICLIVVSVVTIVMVQAVPGSFDQIVRAQNQAVLGTSAGTAKAAVETTSLWSQYWHMMTGFFTFDLPSFKYPNNSVWDILGTAFPVSASLACAAVVVALVIAIPLGVFTAVKHNTRWDYWLMLAITTTTSLPGYLLAVILILIFSRWLHLLPTGGWNSPVSMIMPVLSLALPMAAVLARYMRNSMLESLREDYVMAARARGGSERRVIVTQVFRNSLIAIVTVTGPSLAALTTGTVFIETIFRIPGLGRYFTDAAQSRDVPLLMGTTLFFAVILMGVNLAVDLTYGYLDPRIRLEQTGRSR